jgi:transposase-like protein
MSCWGGWVSARECVAAGPSGGFSGELVGRESTSCEARIDRVAGVPVAARLRAEQVAEARRRHAGGESFRALARELGVAHSTLAAHVQAAEQAGAGAEREAGPGRALAGAAAREVAELEAAYQQAFAAIETLVSAIERVWELRGQQRAWEEANTLGLAPSRPEPWAVRVAHDAKLRPLDRRFTDALQSRW